eukprot:gene32568-39380_t
MGDDYGSGSLDKEERKRLRKLRIEKQSATEDTGVDESQVNDNKSSVTGQQMVDESLAHLDKRKHTGLQQ